MKGIYIPVAVCGADFVERWLRYSLPTLLAPGNLPALAKHYPLKLLLCSTHEDLPRLLASPRLKAARDIMGVRVVPLARDFADLADKVRGENKFKLMNVCHGHGVELAWQDDHGIIFGLGDAIYSDGSFTEVARHISAGKRALLLSGVELQQERLDGLLDEYQIGRDQLALSIPPRTLARIAARGFHPVIDSAMWTSERFTTHPSVLYWPFGDHGMLVRGFHLYPVFVYPDRQAEIRTTFDGDFLVDALSSLDDCAFLDDSDQFFFAGVSNQHKADYMPTSPHRADPQAIARWMVYNTKPFQRELFIHQKIWLHDGTDRAAWRHVEEESDQAIAEVMRCYAQISGGGGR